MSGKTRQDGRLRLFASLVIAVLAGFAVSFAFYVLDRQTRFRDHHLRALTVAGDAFADTVANIDRSINSIVDNPPVDISQEQGTSRVQLKAFADQMKQLLELRDLPRDLTPDRLKQAMEDMIIPVSPDDDGADSADSDPSRQVQQSAPTWRPYEQATVTLREEIELPRRAFETEEANRQALFKRILTSLERLPDGDAREIMQLVLAGDDAGLEQRFSRMQTRGSSFTSPDDLVRYIIQNVRNVDAWRPKESEDQDSQFWTGVHTGRPALFIPCTVSLNIPGGPVTADYVCITFLDLLLEQVYLDDIADKHLLLDGDGNVLVQAGTENALSVQGLPFINQSNAGDGDAEEAAKSALTLDGSSIQSVDLAGSSYKCMIQPFDFPLGAAVVPDKWYMATLVERAGWRQETLKITPNSLLGGGVLLLMLLLLMPFLRIRFIGQREGLNLKTVQTLTICMAVSAALGMLAMLYFVSMERLSHQQETEVVDLSWDLRLNFMQELRQAKEAMAEFERLRPTLTDEPVWETGVASTAPNMYTPFIVSWIDSDGEQRLKWHSGDRITPMVNVKKRSYFTNAAVGDSGVLGSWSEDGTLFLDVIYSYTTGNVELVLSDRLGDSHDASASAPRDDALVQTIIFQPYSIFKPVLPPGYGFCVIDPDGRVLFHHDPRRILRENFIKRLDRNSREQMNAYLRTGARIDEPIHATYGLENVKLFTQPMEPNGWTLVTFAYQEPLWSVLVDGLSGAVFWGVLFFAMIWALLFLAYRLLGPYKSAADLNDLSPILRWYWPRPYLKEVYQDIISMSGLVLVVWVIFAMHEAPDLMVGFSVMVAPALIVWVLCYLRAREETDLDLEQGNLAPRYQVFPIKEIFRDLGYGLAVGLALIVVIWPIILTSRTFPMFQLAAVGFALVMILILLGRLRPLHWLTLGGLWWLAWIYAMSGRDTYVTFAPMVIAILMPTASRWRSLVTRIPSRAISFFKKETTLWAGWRTWYNTAVLMVLICAIILPAISFYLVCSSDSFSMLTKWRQHHLNQSLDERARLFRQNRPDLSEEDASKQIATMIQMQNDAQANKGFIYGLGTKIENRSGDDEIKTRNEFFLTTMIPYIPVFYPSNQHLRIFLETDFYTRFSNQVWSMEDGKTIFYNRENVKFITDQIEVPRASVLFLLAALAALLYLYISKAVDLIFVTARNYPKLLDTENLHGGHILFLRTAPRENEVLGEHLIIRVRAYNQDEIDGYTSACSALPSGSQVTLEEFHQGLTHFEATESTLQLLEGLFGAMPRGVSMHIYSEIDPLYLVTARSADKARGEDLEITNPDRWAAVMRRFHLVRGAVSSEIWWKRRMELVQELQQLRVKIFPDEAKADPLDFSAHPNLTLLAGECCLHQVLEERVAKPLACNRDFLSLNREEVIQQIALLSRAYCRNLWALCSIDEKMVLYTNAKDGFINWRNLDLAHKLIRRNLMLDSPHLRLFSASFREFVLNAELPEVFQSWEDRGGRSTWSKLMGPLRIAAIVLAAFFFLTQRDAFMQMVSTIAAFGAGLPTILNFFNRFSKNDAPQGDTE